MTITYEMDDNLYINLTNRCTNSCTFCVRNRETAANYLPNLNLWLEREPTTEEVVEELKSRNLAAYHSIVFCGFGEPLMRATECIQIAKWLKSNCQSQLRINTNGQANLYHNRNIAAELAGIFDTISISLNAKNAAEYQILCQSEYGESAYQSILDFAATCAKHTQTILSIVTTPDTPPSHITECRKIAENLGCQFRARELI